jgi:sodium/proline symporter
MRMDAGITIGVVFALYVVAMLGIGLAGFRRTNTLEDYLLAGRGLGPFVAALSACASDMSGWLLMGLPGAIFAAGLGQVWIGVGLLVGSYLNWLLVAGPLRRESARLGALTISGYFEKRFPSRTRSLRLVTAIVILAFFLIYTAAGLVAGGKLFEGVFGLDYRLAVLVGAVAIIVYTAMGGFIAVCWTDAVQGVLMIGALVAVPLLAISAAGGGMAWIDSVRAASPASLSWLGGEDARIGPMGLISTLGWGLGYFGMPHIIIRFMAIRSEAEVKRARRIALSWTSLSLMAAVLVGLCGLARFGADGIEDGEKVFIHLIQALFHPIPAGICLAAILAAIMSTADSQLLVCTSVITEDIYRTYLDRDATESELVRVGRISVVVIAALACTLALDPNTRVMGLVSYAWAGFGAAFGPAILLSLYWSAMTPRGALAGIVGGGATVVAWRNLSGGLFDLYEIFPGFVISTVLILVVSCVGRENRVLSKE